MSAVLAPFFDYAREDVLETLEIPRSHSEWRTNVAMTQCCPGCHNLHEGPSRAAKLTVGGERKYCTLGGRSGDDAAMTNGAIGKESKQCQCTYPYYADIASHLLDQQKQRLRGHG